MTTTDQQAVTVAQEDREAAALIFPTHAMTIMSGGWDETENVQVFARHRLASVSSASAEGRVREAFSGVMRGEVVNAGAWSLHLHFGRGDAARDRMRAASSLLGSIVTAPPTLSTAASQEGEWVTVPREPTQDQLIAGNGMFHTGEVPLNIYRAMLAVSPEPVPATNQAGEVKRLVDAATMLQWFQRHEHAEVSEAKEAWDELDAAIEGLATQPATSQAVPNADWAGDWQGDTPSDRAADLARGRQPATSQEGEEHGNHDCLAKRRPGEPMFILLGRDPDAWQIVRAWAARRLNAGGDPEHCLLGMKTANAMRDYAADPANRPASAPSADAYPFLAATPTPPTLSEDLREAIARSAYEASPDSSPRDKHRSVAWDYASEHSRARSYAIADAALAQVKAS